MNDTVRKAMQTNIEMNRDAVGQMMDWHASMVLTSQKQFNALFDGYRNMIDTNHKAARAMQQMVVDTFKTEESAAA
jgi:hypothetical protein